MPCFDKVVIIFFLILLPTIGSTQNPSRGKISNKITLTYAIRFKSDAYSLSPLNQFNLNLLINKLNNLRVSNIEIIGYTDASGTKKYNEDLSKKRAKAVANFLKQSELPIVKNIIRIEGRGVFQNSSKDKEQRIVEITWTELR